MGKSLNRTKELIGDFRRTCFIMGDKLEVVEGYTYLEVTWTTD